MKPNRPDDYAEGATPRDYVKGVSPWGYAEGVTHCEYGEAVPPMYYAEGVTASSPGLFAEGGLPWVDGCRFAITPTGLRRLGVSVALLIVTAIPGLPTALAQTESDDDLGEQLIREATGEDAPGIMGEIMSLMDGSAERLGRDFDPGSKTQQLQQGIVDGLDQAIKSAMRKKSKGGQQQPQSSPDERSAPDESQDQDQASKQQEGAVVEPGTIAPQRGAPGAAGPLGELREWRRGWGNLPDRDRDEVLQGIDEEFLEKYRPLIEEYFRALAEDDES